MEGRRVSSRSKKYNPLFIIFLCLIAATAVLLIVSVTLGIRLASANKKLKAGEEQIKELTASVAQLEQELSEANKKPDPALPTPTDTTNTAAEPAAEADAWLDLTGHSEVEVRPNDDALFDGFQTYYTTAGVNMRSGPGKDYKRVTTVDYGTKVDVAAQQDGWSFVRLGEKFGWISSTYLSTSEPSGGSGRAEATSGSIRP